jgi:hypothetical protein
VAPQVQTAATAIPDIVYVTATPEQPQVLVIVVTATPEPVTATATSTAVPNPHITMANSYDQGNGIIYVSWNADGGDFSNGFQVVWSDNNQSPVYPTDSSTYVSDSNARTVTFNAVAGRTYYIRVCRYTNGTCDLYSDVKSVSMSSSSSISRFANNPPYANQNTYPNGYPNTYPNGYPNAYPNTYPNGYPNFYPTSTQWTSSPTITITGIRGTGYGAAVIYWQAYGDFENGFKILYSTASSQPTYGDYSAYSVDSGSARSASVSGNSDTTYYFRICRYTGSSCDTYSNVYKFTFR